MKEDKSYFKVGNVYYNKYHPEHPEYTARYWSKPPEQSGKRERYNLLPFEKVGPVIATYESVGVGGNEGYVYQIVVVEYPFFEGISYYCLYIIIYKATNRVSY